MSKKFTGAPGKFAGTLPTVLMTFPAGSPDPVPTESYEELPHGTPAWINLAAGAFAGIAEHSVTFPIDSIKVLLIPFGVTKHL